MTFFSCCCSFTSKLRLKLEKIKCKTMFFVTEIQVNCSLLSGRKVVKEAFDILLHNYMQPVPRTHVVDSMSSAKHAQVYKANDCFILLTPKSSNYKSVYNVDSISHMEMKLDSIIKVWSCNLHTKKRAALKLVLIKVVFWKLSFLIFNFLL